MVFVRSGAWGQAGPLCSNQVALENGPSGLIHPLPLPLCLHVFPQYYHMLFHDNMHLTSWFAVSLPKKEQLHNYTLAPEIEIPLNLY